MGLRTNCRGVWEKKLQRAAMLNSRAVVEGSYTLPVDLKATKNLSVQFPVALKSLRHDMCARSCCLMPNFAFVFYVNLQWS